EMAPSSTGQLSPEFSASVAQYLDIWSAVEALDAFMIARGTGLVRFVFADTRTTSQHDTRQFAVLIDRILNATITSGRNIGLFDILPISRWPPPNPALLSSMLAFARLTELGELWRDAGRPYRHKIARGKLLEWVISENATAENPQ